MPDSPLESPHSVPQISEPSPPPADPTHLPSSSSHSPEPATSASEATSAAQSTMADDEVSTPQMDRLSRPQLGSRKSSGTIIIPSNSPTVEVKEEVYDANDARAMSPRRSSDEIEKMGDEAKSILEEQARELQANLLEIVDRVEEVKSEHEKLEGGNKFLQSYIGELMQTSKITSQGAPKPKNRGRSAK